MTSQPFRFESSSPELVSIEEIQQLNHDETENDDDDYENRNENRIQLINSLSDGEDEDIFGISKFATDFNQLISAITQRVDHLSEMTRKSVASNHHHLLHNEIANADLQMAELKTIISDCDDLETELMKIRQIADIAKSFKERMLLVEKSLR